MGNSLDKPSEVKRNEHANESNGVDKGTKEEISAPKLDYEKELADKRVNTISFNVKRIKEYIEILDNEMPEYKMVRMLFVKKALGELFPLIRRIEMVRLEKEEIEESFKLFDKVVKKILTHDTNGYSSEFEDFRKYVSQKTHI
jgi:chaperonin cofactor prefoldin